MTTRSNVSDRDHRWSGDRPSRLLLSGLPACLLDDQPSYLATGCMVRGVGSRERLVLNPQCRFLREGAFVKPSRDVADAVWTVDPVTDIASVFAVGTKLRPVLNGLRAGHVRPGELDAECRTVLVHAGVLISATGVNARRQAWVEQISRLRRHFQRHGYVRLRGLIHPFWLGELRLHYRRLIRAGGMSFGDPQTALRYASHNESAARFFHQQLTALVADIAGEDVKPSYAYVVSYQGGAKLEEHVDREQCEFSVSLLVDYTPETTGPSPWPLCLRSTSMVRIHQKIGDAVLYRGRTIAHFRDQLADDATSTSMLLHYVPQKFAGPLD